MEFKKLYIYIKYILAFVFIFSINGGRVVIFLVVVVIVVVDVFFIYGQHTTGSKLRYPHILRGVNPFNKFS